MKNKLRLFGIIALVMLVSFAFLSCKEPEEEEEITLFDAASGEQTIIKVTSMGGNYNNKYAIGGIDTNPMGVALAAKIENGEVQLKILNSDNSKPAYAEGYYNVVLMIYESESDANSPSGKTPTFSKGAIGVDIGKGTVSVAFSEFKY